MSEVQATTETENYGFFEFDAAAADVAEAAPDVFEEDHLPEAPFADRVSALRDAINDTRDEKRSTVEYGGNRYQADMSSIVTLMGKVTIMQAEMAGGVPNPTRDITTADNQSVTMTMQQIMELGAAIEGTNDRWHRWARSLKDQLAALADGDEAGLVSIEQALAAQ